MSEFQVEIQQRVARFVNDITELARTAAMNALTSALTEAGGATNGARRGRGAKAAITAQPLRRASVKKGEKRPAEELVQIQQTIREYIAANPGKRMEHIKAALGYGKSELVLPIKKLIGEGAVRYEGEKRARTYFPGKRVK
jgi:hypothetical protein